MEHMEHVCNTYRTRMEHIWNLKTLLAIKYILFLQNLFSVSIHVASCCVMTWWWPQFRVETSCHIKKYLHVSWLWLWKFTDVVSAGRLVLLLCVIKENIQLKVDVI